MTVDRLRELGHDLKDIRGTDDEGATDAGLWDVALRERRLLITTDRGFTVYPAASHSGILIVRLPKPNRLKIH